MAINSIYRSSPTRMMGLSSGLDTDSLIQQTLKVHQMRIDAQMRQRTILQWKQETFSGIKDQITSFKNTFLSNLGSMTMMQSKAYNSTIASLSKSSNAFSIATTVNSSVGSIKIGKIKSLAKGATISSAAGVSNDKNGFLSSQRLDSLAFVGGKINFGADYTTVRINDTDMTLLKSDANDAFTGSQWESKITLSDGTGITLRKSDSGDYSYSEDGVNFTDISFIDDKFSVQLGTDGEGNPVNLELKKTSSGQISFNDRTLAFTKEGTVKAGQLQGSKLVKYEDGQILYDNKALEFAGDARIKINDKDITLKSNMTLNQMISTINNTSGINVTMSYDRLTDKFKLESKTIDDGEKIKVSDEGSNALRLLGLNGDENDGSISQVGTKAVLVIDGVDVERNSNSFDYRGMRITLHMTSEDAGETSNEDTIVTFKRDATEAVNNIKKFIEAYNSIIKRIEGLVQERKKSGEASYGPLTDEEKSVMSEKQITEWEAIAKKGILRNDNGLQRLASSLRSSFYESVQSAGMSPSEIGLTTGSFFDGTGGQIIIDEDKLRAALEENPEKVSDIFAGTSGNRGLLWRMNSLMSDYVNESQTRTMMSLESSIKRANEQMLKMQEKMYAEEDKLYRQFAAMETAMSKLQSQGDWMTSMLGGGK